jgi:hypothetical protein
MNGTHTVIKDVSDSRACVCILIVLHDLLLATRAQVKQGNVPKRVVVSYAIKSAAVV